MTLIELLVRWLRARGGEVIPVRSGVRVDLSSDDPLAATLGERFTLVPLAVDAVPPPGVEPVYAGSRIADLLAADVERAGGIAVVRGAPGAAPAEPRFVFSFRVTYITDGRTERPLRFALTPDGGPAPCPPEAAPPLQRAGNGADWREAVERLLPAARAHLHELIMVAVPDVEREAQRRLYRTARRLAAFYREQRGTLAGAEEVETEYRRRLAEEVDRHRLRVTAGLIGVTVVLPRK